MKRFLLIGLLLAWFPVVALADTFDDILTQMRAANAKELVKYFSGSVELTLLDNEGIYSKQQAEQMLRNFFNQNPPKNLNIQHKGASGQGAKYAIATYESANGKFRTYLFLKDSGNGLLIHEFRIERE